MKSLLTIVDLESLCESFYPFGEWVPFHAARVWEGLEGYTVLLAYSQQSSGFITWAEFCNSLL